MNAENPIQKSLIIKARYNGKENYTEQVPTALELKVFWKHMRRQRRSKKGNLHLMSRVQKISSVESLENFWSLTGITTNITLFTATFERWNYVAYGQFGCCYVLRIPLSLVIWVKYWNSATKYLKTNISWNVYLNVFF